MLQIIGLANRTNKRMKIYLDTSVYNRPFDDQSQPKIRIETLAFTIIFQMIEAEEIELVSSSVLEYENNNNPFVFRQTWIKYYLSFAKHIQEINESIRKRASSLEKKKIGNIDALHLACAEAIEVDYFITCDDSIIKRHKDKRMKVLNPVDFIREGGGNV